MILKKYTNVQNIQNIHRCNIIKVYKVREIYKNTNIQTYINKVVNKVNESTDVKDLL